MSLVRGSGGMIIAQALTLNENGYDYRKKMLVHANDIDMNAVYMTYIQCSLYEIPAIVTCSNILSNDGYSETLYTPSYIKDNWHSKLEKLKNNNSEEAVA